MVAVIAILSIAEAATGVVLLEKAFLEISQNSQENTRSRVSMLIKLHAWVTEHLRMIASSLVATVVLFARIILAVELEEITILLLVKQLVLGKVVTQDSYDQMIQ